MPQLSVSPVSRSSPLVRALGLLVAGIALLGAVDVDPPAVPNPYNTSDARALRDHLEESFGLKTNDTLSLEELQALYRKTWNDDQDARHFDDNSSKRPVDPRWLAGYQAEQEANRRTKALDVLRTLGIVTPEGATSEQLDVLIHDAHAAKEADNKARLAKERELAIQQATDHSAVVTPTLKTANTTTYLPMRRATTADKKPDSAVIASFEVLSRESAKTKMETEAIHTAAVNFVAKRTAFITEYKGELELISETGLEIWFGTRATNDPEKVRTAVFIFNVSPHRTDVEKVSLKIIGSTRNAQDYQVGSGASWTEPFGTASWSFGLVYVDPNQIMSVIDAKVTLHE